MVEHSGPQQVVQYRGHILPLLHVSNVVDCGSANHPSTDSSPLQVIVYTQRSRSVGLVVENILDIVEERLVLEHTGRRHGVVGSALIQQRVTDLLDVEGVVKMVEPAFFEQSAGA